MIIISSGGPENSQDNSVQVEELENEGIESSKSQTMVLCHDIYFSILCSTRQ